MKSLNHKLTASVSGIGAAINKVAPGTLTHLDVYSAVYDMIYGAIGRTTYEAVLTATVKQVYLE